MLLNFSPWRNYKDGVGPVSGLCLSYDLRLVYTVIGYGRKETSRIDGLVLTLVTLAGG